MISLQSCGLPNPPKSILDIAAHVESMPAFEVVTVGKHYKIYADGRVEGFEGAPFIINRIPQLLSSAALAAPKPEGGAV